MEAQEANSELDRSNTEVIFSSHDNNPNPENFEKSDNQIDDVLQ